MITFTGKKHEIAVFVFTLVLTLVASTVSADDFEDIMASEMNQFNSHKKEFQDYRTQIDLEFEIYKQIVDSEYKKYKGQILKYWDSPEVTGKKKFVEYSPDFKIKKSVDYENGTLALHIILPKDTGNTDIDKKIEQQLMDLVAENSKTAHKRDMLSQNIEKRLNKAVKNIKKATVEEVPIISDVIIGVDKPDKQQVITAVKTLRKKEKIKKRSVPGSDDSQVVSVTIKLPPGSMAKKAELYIDTVKKYAKKRKIDPALILAVMETESAFNPMARSYVPAYGLMQIVPRSAGLDASEFVFGKQMILSPSYLYNGDNNVRMGAAYIHILNYRYLKAITDEESRLYCVIAAYNTGAGNVARAFTGRTNIRAAAKTINSLSPDTVYRRLLKKLPHHETRNYIKNVAQRMRSYK